MANKVAGSRYCSVINCTSTDKYLKAWKGTLCDLHTDAQGLGVPRRDCPCCVPYSFHTFPPNEADRLKWIHALQRKDYYPRKRSVVCSLHFVDGRPTKNHPYPSINLGHNLNCTPGRRLLKRKSAVLSLGMSERTSISTTAEELNSYCEENESFNLNSSCQGQVSFNSSQSEEGSFSTSLEVPSNMDVTKEIETQTICPKETESDTNMSQRSSADEIPTISNNEGKQCHCKGRLQTYSIGTQWEDPTLLDHSYVKLIDLSFNTSKHSIGTQLDMHDYENRLTNKDCKFFTGLDILKFNCLVVTLTNLNLELICSLKIADQLLLVLMKLRLNLLFQDLGRRFHISGSLAGRIFKFWLDVLYEHITDVVCWLPRETIRSTLPHAFKVNYPNTTCIIDCTEIYTQRPRKLRPRAVTYSNYKSHNTAKKLITIAPSGYIMHVSQCYGGRASDNFITRDSGLYSLLRPGDEVMADRGFTIQDDLDFLQVKLNIPAFTRNEEQLQEADITRTRRIATVRIEVERVINKLKCYRILQGVLPLHFSNKIDKIILVCAALCNLQPSISSRKK